MKRRDFLLLTATSLPAITLGKNLNVFNQQSKKPFVVKSNESRFGEQTLIGGKSPNDIKISSKDSGNELSVFEYTGNEKGGPPLHYHLKQDEIFYVIEGEYLFKVGDETHLLKKGETIFLPRRIPHTWAQLTDHGKMVFMFQPSGKMEDFFRKIGALKSPPTPEEGAKLFAAHDMKVVGPPLEFDH